MAKKKSGLRKEYTIPNGVAAVIIALGVISWMYLLNMLHIEIGSVLAWSNIPQF